MVLILLLTSTPYIDRFKGPRKLPRGCLSNADIQEFLLLSSRYNVDYIQQHKSGKQGVGRNFRFNLCCVWTTQIAGASCFGRRGHHQ